MKVARRCRDWLGLRPKLLIYGSVSLEARRPPDPPADDGFEVSYVPDDGAEHRVPLAQAWAVPLEQGLPVRRFTSRKGQRHLSGLWWSATTGGHVGFESWLERDHLLHLDFDPSVVGSLTGCSGCTGPPRRARRSHIRRTSSPAERWLGGGGRLPAGERRRPRDVSKFDATARACALAGWEYRLLGAADALVTANLRWWPATASPPPFAWTVDVLRRVFATPTPLMVGAESGGRPDRSLAGVVPSAVVSGAHD